MPISMTDAAERVLKAIGKPMYSTEIIRYAIDRGWISPAGKTPDHSLQAAIGKEIQRGKQSRFRVVVNGRGPVHRKYWLSSEK